MTKLSTLLLACITLLSIPAWSQILNSNINIEIQDQDYWSSADGDDAFFQGEDEIVMKVTPWMTGLNFDVACNTWSCNAPCYGPDISLYAWATNMAYTTKIDMHVEGYESDNGDACTYYGDDDLYFNGWAGLDNAPLTTGRNCANWHYNFGSGNPAWLFPGQNYQMRIRAAWRYANGDALNSPLQFGTVNNASRSHICTNYVKPSGADLSSLGWTNQSGQSSPDVFYSFTLSDASEVAISTDFPETNFDTYLRLFNASGLLIGSDDDGGSGSTSLITIELCPGTYTVAVEGYNSSMGDYKVQVSTSSIEAVYADFSNISLPTCDLSNGTLTATGQGGIPSYTYLWSNGSTSSTVSNLAPGDYSLTVTDYCGSTSVEYFSMTSTDSGAPTMICQDQLYVLNGTNDQIVIDADELDGGSFDDCGIAGLSISQSSFNASNVGTNIVTLTATDVVGNTASCDAIVTIELNTAVGDIAELIDWQVYPNPTTGALTVYLESPDLGEAQLIVSDLYGRVLMQQAAQNGRTDLSLEGYAPGMYLVEVRKGANSRTQRVLLQE